MKTETAWIQCDESKLFGEIFVPDRVPAPAVLVCHGMNKHGFHLLKIYGQLARTACESGFVSLLFDFRGVGRSPGEFDYGVGERRDVKCALNYLSSRLEVTKDRLYVVGHSLGGAVSIYALLDEMRVKGLALWSVPMNHDYNVKKFVRNTRGRLGLWAFLLFSRTSMCGLSRLFGLNVYGIKLCPKNVREKLMKLNECEAISKLKGVALLVVNGENDDIVGVDEAKQVFASANNPKSLLIIRSTDHIFRKKENELVEKTIGWIRQVDLRDQKT